MPTLLQRAGAVALAAAAALLLLACATTAPSRASQAHAGLDMRGKRCIDCHPDGKPKKARSAAGTTSNGSSGGSYGASPGGSSPNYEQGPGR